MIKYILTTATFAIFAAVIMTLFNFFDYSFIEWAGLTMYRGTAVALLMYLLAHWYPTQVYECKFMPSPLKTAILSM